MSGLLLAALLTAGAVSGQNAPRAQERARGEELLRRARADLAEANRLNEASIQSAQAAQQQEETANQKRLEARRLQREAFLLIRDSNRMRAAELRSRAEEEQGQVKTEGNELRRLRGILARQQQTASDATSAAAKLRDLAGVESSPAEKAELSKMADSLNEQGAQASAEASGIEKRIMPIQAEIGRLNADIRELNEAAQKLAPM
jgi:hypothetical protein